MMAETYMLQALQNGLASIRSNPSQLADILTALNANELSAAQQWFGNANNQIIIAPGFPMKPEQLPFIGITVGNDDQIESQTGIGLDYYTSTDSGSGIITQYRGAPFNGAIKGTIYTTNADLIVWLSAVCKWSLLSQYDWLGSDNGGAMRNIRIGLGDYEPSPGFLPIFSFARGVYLYGEYDCVFTTQPQAITSDSVTGSFSTQNDSFTIISN
ncbi:hypothetical protein LSG31_00395 [Fodinisporobacter ferrooxydans]|uniref:Uncharacterized protein n=1 Tax=Fodinisporobacter ferrooxydans TaxID=2901836 RepID=A0ABY4CJT6_9BACL|nr:hypothetical protein LSG31_00395 [Alicyclobacillaceae bacterium MYW30-H2]